jgi:tetratricopeptide (TPR) repeat protein
MAFFEIEPPKNTRREVVLESFLWLMALGGLTLGLLQSDHILIFSTSLWFFYLLAICLHELGHAVAGVLMKGEVLSITLGRSPFPEGAHYDFKFFGWPCQIYAPPYAGSVQMAFLSNAHFRTRVCLMIAAGPLVTLIASLPGLFLLEQHDISNWAALVLSWSAINAYLFLHAAIPYEGTKRGKKITNDGMQFLRTLALKDDEVLQKVMQNKLTRDYQAMAKTLSKCSADELISKYKSTLPPLPVLIALLDKLSEQDDPRFHEYLWKLLSHPDAPETFCSKIIDIYFTKQLAKAPPANQELAERLSVRLLQLNDCLSTRGTRGSVLIDLGRIEEGKAMLKDVLIKTTSTIDKSYANIFLALAEKQEGNLTLAREYAEKAAKIDPDCPALKRVSDLLSSSTQVEKKE